MTYPFNQMPDHESVGTNEYAKRVVLKGRNLQQAFTILNGQQVSNSYVNLGGKVLVALSLPAEITQTSLTFQACDTPNGTYQDVYDSTGALVTVTIGAGRIVALTGTALQALASLQYIKIKTGSAVTADRTIVAIAKG